MSGDYQAILDAGKLLGGAVTPDGGRPYVILQNKNGDQVIHDLEHLLDQPVRIRAEVIAHTADTFVRYFLAYKKEASDEDGPAIFANRDQFQITGIFDYHSDGGAASWCTHRIIYTAPRAPEWKTWTGANGQRMPQVEFAQHIEDNVIDIREPPGAEILEIARNLQAKKAVEFSSAIRLNSGAQEFTYNETISGSSAKGKLSIPEHFTLGIPVFQGDQLYEVKARLRYRIDNGKLQLWYDLYRPDRREADAFATITDAIAKETAMAIWHGTVAK